MTDKPPYRVPLMAELAGVEWNGLVAADSFSGGGGTCTGLRMAGYRVAWACEFVDEAADCYAANHPDAVLCRKDIRDVTGREVLDAVERATGRRELDLWTGSPPCVGFSTAGIREKGWGRESTHADGSSGRSDDLFLEYARLLGELRPRAFAAENVSGLVKGVAKGYFAEIMAALGSHGYRVQARMLDAQWLGVPQARQRVIIVGIRDDLGVDPEFPAPLPYRYSIRDALPNLTGYAFDTSGRNQAADPERELDGPAPTVGLSNGAAPWHHKVAGGELGVRTPTGPGMQMRDVDPDAPIGSIRAGRSGIELVNAGPPLADDDPEVGRPPIAHDPPKDPDVLYVSLPAHAPMLDPEKGERIDLEGTAIGKRWDRLEPGQMDTSHGGPHAPAGETHYRALFRPGLDEPSDTITAASGGRGVAGVTHPTERRKLTLAELRRLCGWPDDATLPGTYQQGWARLGNSVPPPMAAAYAACVRDVLLRLDGCHYEPRDPYSVARGAAEAGDR